LVELVAPASTLPERRQSATNQKVHHKRERVFTDATSPAATQQEDREAARYQAKEKRCEALGQQGIPSASNLARNQHAGDHCKAG
jgi:hypothetical protein